MTPNENAGDSWPEQDAIYSWLNKHGITASVPQILELSKAVTKERVKIAAKRDMLRKALEAIDATLKGQMDYEHTVCDDNPSDPNCRTPARVARAALAEGVT